MIDDLKLYIKSLRGKLTLTVAGISTGAIVASGLSACTTDELDSVDDPSEVITSEISSEVVKATEEPTEEISEEPSEVVEEVVEMPELPIRDENGEIYVPGEITIDEVYAKIDEMVENNDFEDNLERDKAISIMLFINSPYISKETFTAVKDDYLGNIYECNLESFTQLYFLAFDEKYKSEAVNVPIEYLFLDNKQAEIAKKIEKYYKSSNYSNDELYTQILNSILLFASEDKGDNPINYFGSELLSNTNLRHLKYELKQNNIEQDIYYIGYTVTDDLGNENTALKFADGKTYVLSNTYGSYDHYKSSHEDKILKLENQ